MSETEIVEVALGDGQTMLARVYAADSTQGGPRDVGLREQLSLSGLTDTLRQLGSAVVGALDQVRPERASVEFGLDLAVKSGKLTGLLVDGDASATMKVTLEWQRTRPDTAAAQG